MTTSSFSVPVAPTLAVKSRRTLPLAPLLPAAVVALGLAMVMALGIAGVWTLRVHAASRTEARAQGLARVVAARVAQVDIHRRHEVLQLAARRSHAELLIVTSDGRVREDATLGLPDATVLHRVLTDRNGFVAIRTGEARFAVAPIGPPPGDGAVVVFVPSAGLVEGAPAMLTTLVALTALFLGAAAVISAQVARDATRDIGFVTGRVVEMADARVDPAGEPVAVLGMDEVGQLAAAFNELVARFGAAERAHRENLQRARAADRDRSTFLAAVSHELRSPLNAILGFADILIQEVDGPLTKAQREDVEQVRGSGQHLLDLINDILEFSAIESGQLRLARAPVDLTQIALEVFREASVVARQKGLATRVEAPVPVVALADARRVRQIVQNLVSNAVKFTQHGEVVVRVQKQGRFGLVAVQDSGPGIRPQDRELIFAEYKQASTERGKKRGTGLGLAIARRLALLHGGTIHLESALGTGSLFTLLLPTAEKRDGTRTKTPSGRLDVNKSGRIDPGAVAAAVSGRFDPNLDVFEPPTTVKVKSPGTALLPGRPDQGPKRS